MALPAALHPVTMGTNLPATGPLTVTLKLGGALLTIKTQPYTLRTAIWPRSSTRCVPGRRLIERLIVRPRRGVVPAIRRWWAPAAQSFATPDQLIHLTDAQNRVMELRMVAQACHQAGLPVATIMPGSHMKAADGFVRQEMFLGGRRFSPPGRRSAAGRRRVGGPAHLTSACIAATPSPWSWRCISARRVSSSPPRSTASTTVTRARSGSKCDWRSFPEAASGLAVGAAGARRASGAMAGKLDAVRRAVAALDAGLRVDVISMLAPGNLAALLRGEDVGTRVIA
ncbi:MAG: hypothetical protein R2838_09140 [Caldilineaceae bacterium]